MWYNYECQKERKKDFMRCGVAAVDLQSVITCSKGYKLSEQGLADLMYFESNECELGRFSILALVAHILDEPSLSGDQLFSTSVIMRYMKLCYSVLVGKAFADLYMPTKFSFQEPFIVNRETGMYYEIEYLGSTGYILKSSVDLIETQHAATTASRLDIYAGQRKTLKLKNETEFSKFQWSTTNSNVAYYDASTKQVVAKKAGTATIIGTYDDKLAYCTVTVIKKWQSPFDAVAQNDIAFKVGPSDTKNTFFTIPAGTQISVRGNVNSKWLYVRCTYKQFDYYGYVNYNGTNLKTNTSDSTKGDMLFYATLDWRFPVKDLSYNYISSPYGPRGIAPPRHVGIDIVGAEKGKIEGKEVVAACSGTVLIAGYNTSMGNYVSITTDCVDPVTGNKLVIVYMHLSAFNEDNPKPSDQTSVKAGDVIGRVGNTGNSSGAHLHFDVNNENESHSNSKYGYAYKHSINPIYFFISQKVNLKPCSSPNGLYWPGIE